MEGFRLKHMRPLLESPQKTIQWVFPIDLISIFFFLETFFLLKNSYSIVIQESTKTPANRAAKTIKISTPKNAIDQATSSPEFAFAE